MEIRSFLFLGILCSSTLGWGFEPLDIDDWLPEECILSSEDVDSDRASLVDLGGRLLAVWEEGSVCNKRLVAKERARGQWKTIKLPIKDDYCSYSNPVLAKISPREVILFYEKYYHQSGIACSCARISTTGGRLWSDEQILPPGILGVTRNPPLVCRSTGVLYLPVYDKYPYSRKLTSSSTVWLEVIDIKLRKWKTRKGPVYSSVYNKQPKEPAIVAMGDGSLLLVCRNHSGSSYDSGASILFSHSFDDGRSWSEVEAYPWPNPDTSLTAVYGLDTLFIFANNSLIRPENLSCFSISNLETHWNDVVEIERGYSEHPSACLDKEGYMHIVYTVKNNGIKTIKYKKLSAQQLVTGEAIFHSEVFDDDELQDYDLSSRTDMTK